MKKQTKNTKQDKDYSEGIYPILKTPNFYFPLADTGKKFTVENTYNLMITDKKIIDVYNDYKKMEKIGNIMYIKEYSDIIWHAIKKEGLDKEYKDCWLVPIRISKFGKNLEVDIDVLRPVSNNKNRKKQNIKKV